MTGTLQLCKQCSRMIGLASFRASRNRGEQFRPLAHVPDKVAFAPAIRDPASDAAPIERRFVRQVRIEHRVIDLANDRRRLRNSRIGGQLVEHATRDLDLEAPLRALDNFHRIPANQAGAVVLDLQMDGVTNRLPPLQGEGRGGDGYGLRDKTHPHPNLPLEGEGITAQRAAHRELSNAAQPSRQVSAGAGQTEGGRAPPIVRGISFSARRSTRGRPVPHRRCILPGRRQTTCDRFPSKNNPSARHVRLWPQPYPDRLPSCILDRAPFSASISSCRRLPPSVALLPSATAPKNKNRPRTSTTRSTGITNLK